MKGLLSAFVYSFLILSTFSWAVFSINDVYFLELAIVAAVVYWRISGDEIGSMLVVAIETYSSEVQFSLYILAIAASIGLIRDGNAIAAYAEFRSLAFAVCGFALVPTLIAARRTDLLFYLAICTCVLCALYWLIVIIVGGNGLESKASNPILAAFIAALVASLYGSGFRYMIAMVCLGVFAAIGFYRQYWIVFACGALLGVLKWRRLGLLDSKRAFLSLLAGAFALTALLAFVTKKVEEDESLYIQSIGKTQDLLDFNDGIRDLSDSDALRKAYFLYLLEEAPALILPHGLDSRSVFGKVSRYFDSFETPPNTIDSALLYLIYHLGYIIVIPLAILGVKNAISAVWLFGCAIVGLILCCAMVPLLFDGGSLTVTSRSFWFGGIFGILSLGRFSSVSIKEAI